MLRQLLGRGGEVSPGDFTEAQTVALRIRETPHIHWLAVRPGLRALDRELAGRAERLRQWADAANERIELDLTGGGEGNLDFAGLPGLPVLREMRVNAEHGARMVLAFLDDGNPPAALDRLRETAKLLDQDDLDKHGEIL